MSSPSSSSSGTAGSRRSRRPSPNPPLRLVAAALAAAATVWAPIALPFIAGPLGLGIAVVAAVAALAFYVWVTPAGRVSVLVGAVLNVGGFVLAFLAFLLTGCGDRNGHISGGVWAVGLVVSVVSGTWALQRPSRAWWGIPLSTLLATGVVIGLATALTGSTGLCPD